MRRTFLQVLFGTHQAFASAATHELLHEQIARAEHYKAIAESLANENSALKDALRRVADRWLFDCPVCGDRRHDGPCTRTVWAEPQGWLPGENLGDSGVSQAGSVSDGPQ